MSKALSKSYWVSAEISKPIRKRIFIMSQQAKAKETPWRHTLLTKTAKHAGLESSCLLTTQTET